MATSEIHDPIEIMVMIVEDYFCSGLKVFERSPANIVTSLFG